jgi:hypothetical protein
VVFDDVQLPGAVPQLSTRLMLLLATGIRDCSSYTKKDKASSRGNYFNYGNGVGLPGQCEGGKSVKLSVSMYSYHLMLRVFAPVASPLRGEGKSGSR